MSFFRKIQKTDVLLFALLLFGFVVLRLPFLLNPVFNIDVSLTVAEAVSRFFKNTPLIVSPDEGYIKFLFVLPVLFFTREGMLLGVFPLLFSSLSVLLTFFVAFNMFGKKAAWFGSLLLVFSFWHADYSVYIEMYTLYLCQSLLLLFLFCKFLDTQNNKYHMSFWIMAIISFFTYTPFLVLILSIFVWLLLFRKYEVFYKMLKGSWLFCCLLAGYSFKLFSVFKHRSLVGDSILGSDVSGVLYEFFLSGGAFCLPVVLILAGFLLYRKKKAFLFFVLISVILFFTFIFFYSAYHLKLAFFPRYLLFVYPLWVILLGASLSSVSQRNHIISLCLFVCLLYPTAVKSYELFLKKDSLDDIRYIKDQKGIFRHVKSYIDDNIVPGDIVLVDSFVYTIALAHYLDPDNQYPVGMFSGFGKMGLSFDMSGKNTVCHIDDVLKDTVINLQKHYPRIWVVCFENIPADDFLNGCVLKSSMDGKVKIFLAEFESFLAKDILNDFEKKYLCYPYERS